GRRRGPRDQRHQQGAHGRHRPPVVHVHVFERAQRHAGHLGIRGILHHGDAAAALDALQAFRAVVEEPAQEHPDRALRPRHRSRAEERVDGRPGVLLLGAVRQADEIPIHQHVVVRRRDVDAPRRDALAVACMRGRQRPAPREQLRQDARVAPDVLHDEDRRGKVGRKRGRERLQRADPARGAAHHDDALARHGRLRQGVCGGVRAPPRRSPPRGFWGRIGVTGAQPQAPSARAHAMARKKQPPADPSSARPKGKRARRAAAPATVTVPARAAAAATVDPVEPTERSPAFPIVAIGASAGGIEAVTELLKALPRDTGMAFVVVQHLLPTRESLLSEIFARATGMPVTEAKEGASVEENHVYVIPPNRTLVLDDGRLRLSPRVEHRGQARPIDEFMRSLADHHGYQSIGVVLSGSSNDGTLGLEEIKAAGGITFAQDATAEQDSMPRSAVASGVVDFVLSPAEIAHELARISQHPYVAPAGPSMFAEQEPAFRRVIEILRQATGVDFAKYKRNTLQRRITRRMVLHKMEGLRDYVRLLQAKPDEVGALYQDVLINVTGFFRNPEAYE